jgi:hypothetical protein
VVHYASNAFLVSPAKQAGIQPITIYNVGRVTEHFTLKVSAVAGATGHCAPTYGAVPWFRISRDSATVRPGHHKTIAVSVSHVPPGRHDVSVIVSERSTAKGIGVTSAAGAQEVIGTGHAAQCATLADPPPQHSSGTPVGVLAGVAVAAILIVAAILYGAHKAIRRPSHASGAYRGSHR